jgi:hypothetical protein
MRISDWAKAFGVRVERVMVQPGAVVYRVKDIFTTRDGAREPSSVPGSIPAWARDAYMTSTFDDAGAATHLFGAIENGGLAPGVPFRFWTHADDANHTNQTTKRSGWANLPMSPDANFVPDRGEVGPWAWKPLPYPADTVIGGGLPQRWHVSTFAVWERTVEPGGTDPGDDDSNGSGENSDIQRLINRIIVLEQTTGLLSAEVKTLKKLLGQWVGD